MKTTYYICCLVITGMICGCSKSGDAPNTSYTITGLTDVAVRQYADTSFIALYHIACPADVHEPVTFNIEELPPGITATPRIVTDTTSFSVQVVYHMRMTAAASFPVTITLYAGSIGKVPFTFNVIVSSSPAFAYLLATPNDINVPLYSDTTVRVPVTASYISGMAEPVSVTADMLPAGVTVLPAAVGGTPSFTETMSFHIKANSQGNFPVVLHGHSSQGASVANFNINVQPQANCAPVLAGNYNSYTTCASYSGAGTGTAVSFVSATGTNKLRILLPFADATAEVNCTAATLNVLPGISGGFIFAGGTGSFNASTIVLNYSLSGTINSACTTTLTR